VDRAFRADAAVWLNLAPDHLNWHASMATYEAAKARIFDAPACRRRRDRLRRRPVVMRDLASAPGRHRHVRRRRRRLPPRRRLAGRVRRPDRRRRGDAACSPHDITNALAASALVLETGLAGPDAIGEALATFVAPPAPARAGRLDRGGVTYYNDSKATTPHAASVAIRAFESLVLIAGGSRKGVDLSPMAAEAHRVRAVVAIGEAAPTSGRSSKPAPPSSRRSMAEAVAVAASLAHPGDAVVLSPGCASFDWYTGTRPAATTSSVASVGSLAPPDRVPTSTPARPGGIRMTISMNRGTAKRSRPAAPTSATGVRPPSPGSTAATLRPAEPARPGDDRRRRTHATAARRALEAVAARRPAHRPASRRAARPGPGIYYAIVVIVAGS
jgi:hypothetical protein